MRHLNAGGRERSPAHNKTQPSDVCCSNAANSTLMHSSLSCALTIKRGCQRRREERKKGWRDGGGVTVHGPCRLSNLAKGSFLAFLVPPHHRFSQRTLEQHQPPDCLLTRPRAVNLGQ
ncbi:uncharacterized [Tachysurus ichikawai]